MRYVDEFRDPQLADGLLRGISERATRRWSVMEVCGGQTHTLIRSGIDELVSDSIELIHGPGCPVCVTPLEKIDRAQAIARRGDTILCSYGDMMRVPGSRHDLLTEKAGGADVRIVYSPLDAVRIAQENPGREVVFFAVGFETTAPANSMAVLRAADQGVSNFSVLVSHVRVPPAISVVLDDPDCRVNGFIAPGHVCSIMGYSEYEELSARYGTPFVVAGFEPLDLLQGLLMLVELLESGRGEVGNQYTRSVRREGNEKARVFMEQVFEVGDMNWRGIGRIPLSGLRLREAYAAFDAETRFDVSSLDVEEPEACIAGEVLQGRKRPHECPAFGGECTPESPLGAPMVSSEGACSAYYAFRRHQEVEHGV
jgi:hydrogenase expression/formation protein HypD